MGRTIDIDIILPRRRARDTWNEESHKRAKNGEFGAGDHRQAQAYHETRAAEHASEAKSRGESAATPPAGSHAAAATRHRAAAFANKRAAEELESKSGDHHQYVKEAVKYGSQANKASKDLASGKNDYPTEKSNNYSGGPGKTTQEHMAARISRHLSSNRIRMR